MVYKPTELRNTRASRKEQILPNVDKMKKRVNGKLVPLTKQERDMAICKVYYEFFKQHLNYGGNFDFFYGLRDDFFTEDTYTRIAEYGSTFYDIMKQQTLAGKRKPYFNNVKTEIKMLKKYENTLNEELARKRRAISRRNRWQAKQTEGMVARLGAINEYYNEESHSTKGTITLALL